MSFCNQIKKRFIRLSRGQRKVAQFIIDNPNVIATHIASDVGKLIGVSESTVIRFCYAMELSGFSELQQKIKADLTGEEITVEESNQKAAKKNVNLLNEVMNRDVACILNTINLTNEEQFDQAIKLLHQSTSLYVLGLRQSSPSASFFTCTLSNYRKHVKQIQPEPENIVKQIGTMEENSLLFVLALEELDEDAFKITKWAKSRNVKVIAITHSNISAIRDYADIMFTVGAQKNALAETITAAHSLIHALVEGMVAQNKKEYKNFQKANAQFDNNYLYLEKTLYI
ncbi:MurR/RpiR family transcriptional regulator [Ureibacillus chungkukjangi]|uniref:RpiR family transcriptional regulator n=1 Tax=Ureibacillus chungkukjangi TaxID=1202712 RepID=A0A318TX64_9BACL|nr:MurR/RpiR family transcriptional regulator [Ureibacillus chungkukjangi]MCM3389706.1 MurR/RpiR family transcriptional regulator [Ureibacillus chungkukjangi]PYF06595.1 RpiR family transcriptional regulator [Ureibacillus chungkukjangi]